MTAIPRLITEDDIHEVCLLIQEATERYRMTPEEWETLRRAATRPVTVRTVRVVRAPAIGGE